MDKPPKSQMAWGSYPSLGSFLTLIKKVLGPKNIFLMFKLENLWQFLRKDLWPCRILPLQHVR